MSAHPLQPEHQYAYSLHSSVYILYGSNKENLLNNRELVKVALVSFIRMTFAFHSWVKLWVEIKRQSPLCSIV